MKKNWKLACTVIMIAVVGLFWACGDDGPASPTSMDALPSATPQVSASTSDSPANPTASPTYTERPDLDPKRGNNPFGSGYACEDYPVGVAPVWVNDKESKWTIWTIKNTTDQRWRVSGKVYGEKEPGCAATVRGRKGADDILIIEDPEWIEVGETRDVRWRIDMSAMYNEDYLCGRFQIGIGLKPETHGNFWNHTDRVIDTGSNECDPPPEHQCPANADVEVVVSLPDQVESRRCPDWYPVTISFTQQGMTKVEKTLPSEYVQGNGLPVEENGYSVIASIIGYNGGLECGSDSETILVPGCTCTPCENTELIVTKQKGNMLYVGDPPSGTYYTVGGSLDKHYSSGTYGPFAEECESQITIRVNLYDEKCGEPVKCAPYWDTHFEGGDCPTCVDVTLDASVNVDDNNVAHASATGSGATHYTFQRHNMGSSTNVSMPWSENFQLNCAQQYLATFKAYDGDEVCKTKTVTETAGECCEPVRYTSSNLNYSATGWAGWSCPAGTHAIGGGVTGNTYPMGPQGIAQPGATIGGHTYPVFPHWTFGPGETGYVAQNGGTSQTVQIYVDCLCNPDAPN
jgi:hypothetical protein